jgi:hypothetical protein
VALTRCVGVEVQGRRSCLHVWWPKRRNHRFKNLPSAKVHHYGQRRRSHFPVVVPCIAHVSKCKLVLDLGSSVFERVCVRVHACWQLRISLIISMWINHVLSNKSLSCIVVVLVLLFLFWLFFLSKQGHFYVRFDSGIDYTINERKKGVPLDFNGRISLERSGSSAWVCHYTSNHITHAGLRKVLGTQPSLPRIFI